jgi:hypothetical protein
MPSVYAVWSGQCRDVAARRELLGHVEEIAALSHSYFAGSPTIVRWQGPIAGRILISAEHFQGHEPAGTRLERVSEDLYALDHATLEGIEFRLYDPRYLYVGEDRVSFVFTADADPALDGRLVYVEDRAECARYRDPEIQAADWLLGVPSIHLRYYLEQWTDRLMGWVKRFYVPGLRYWRYEEHWTDPETLAAAFAGRTAAAVLPELLDTFRAEAWSWDDIGREARDFYAAVGRPVTMRLPGADASEDEMARAITDALERAVPANFADPRVREALDKYLGDAPPRS